MRNKIVELIRRGVYDQNELFRILYPSYFGHYSKLRDMISEVKNHGIG